jgi:hypothetical protein
VFWIYSIKCLFLFAQLGVYPLSYMYAAGYYDTVLSFSVQLRPALQNCKICFLNNFTKKLSCRHHLSFSEPWNFSKTKLCKIWSCLCLDTTDLLHDLTSAYFRKGYGLRGTFNTCSLVVSQKSIGFHLTLLLGNNKSETDFIYELNAFCNFPSCHRTIFTMTTIFFKSGQQINRISAKT